MSGNTNKNDPQNEIDAARARARGRTAEFDRLLLRIPPFTLYVHGLSLIHI